MRKRGIFDVGRVRQQDLLLRALGASLAAIAFLAIHYLAAVMRGAPQHPTTFAEIGLAALGFIGFSLGGALMSLGAHIHDQVEIAERWCRRPSGKAAFDQLGSIELPPRSDMRNTGDASQRWPISSGLRSAW